jgi:hypothetical protein
VVALALLAARHFATTSWPLASGNPGVLVAAGTLLLVAQTLKAYGWGRLFTPEERPKTLALAAGNGGAALIGVALPGRFDDAMRVAVVRRYPGCPAGVRTLCLSLVMLGLIDSVALAPLAFAACVLSGRRVGRARSTRRRGGRRSRGRCPDPRPATTGREQAGLALPAWALAEPAHDLPAGGIGSVGARVCLLARPGSRALLAPWHARGRLLVLARAPFPVRRCSSGRAADRSGRGQQPRSAPGVRH